MSASYPAEARAAMYESIKGRNAPGSSPALRPHCKRRGKHENSPSRILPGKIMWSEKPPVPAAIPRWTPPTPHNNVLRILPHQQIASSASFPPGPPGTAVAGFFVQPQFPPSRRPSQRWPTGQAAAARTHVGQTWRQSGQALYGLQQPDLGVPVCQRQAQPLQIGVTCP